MISSMAAICLGDGFSLIDAPGTGAAIRRRSNPRRRGAKWFPPEKLLSCSSMSLRVSVTVYGYKSLAGPVGWCLKIGVTDRGRYFTFGGSLPTHQALSSPRVG
jgi:hypothetical protein